MFEIILFIEIPLYDKDKLRLKFKYNTTYKLNYY